MTRACGVNIIETPCCGALLSTVTYSSINTRAWEYWTDGYDHGSLFSTSEGLRRCLCGRCFLLDTAKHIETIREPSLAKPAPKGWETRKDTWWTRLLGRETQEEIMLRYDTRPIEEIEAERIRFESTPIPPSPNGVEDSELLALIQYELESEVANASLLETARRLYWRYLNQPFRDVYRAYREAHADEVDEKGYSKTFPEYLPSVEQTRNMEQLAILLESAAEPSWLELAELYRELGDMDAAAKALVHPAPFKKFKHFVISELVTRKVRCPVMFMY
jgi:hypothetical protein